MRQLELLLGADNFRDGLREYLGAHKYGNATWADLIKVLDARTDADLSAWSQAWVEERGRPRITLALERSSDGTRISLTQDDPLGRSLVWPQHLAVAVGYADRVDLIEADLDRARIIDLPAGRPVLWVLPDRQRSGLRRLRSRQRKSRGHRHGAAESGRSADARRRARHALGIDARWPRDSGTNAGRNQGRPASGGRRAQHQPVTRVHAFVVLAVHGRRRPGGGGTEARGAAEVRPGPRQDYEPEGGLVRDAPLDRDNIRDTRVAGERVGTEGETAWPSSRPRPTRPSSRSISRSGTFPTPRRSSMSSTRGSRTSTARRDLLSSARPSRVIPRCANRSSRA